MSTPNRIRKVATATTLDQVIELVSKSSHPEMVWVGKNYSKAQLMVDLNNIKDDHICDGGATFNILAKSLKEQGAKRVVLFLSLIHI